MKEYVELKTQKIEISYDYDVVVVGGGTAGVVAGIAAANEGVKTLIIEKFGGLGGTQTMSLVTPIMHEGLKNGNAESYISKEIRDRLTKKGYAHKDNGNYSSWFECEMLKSELEQMAVEAGCDILLNSDLVSVVTKDKHIDAVIISNKAGLQAVRAKQFIDCTGDGDLSVMAGADYQFGNPDGKNQSVSLRFEMIGVDLDKFGEYLREGGQTDEFTYPPLLSTFKGLCCPALDGLMQEKIDDGTISKDDLHYVQLFSMPGNKTGVSFNCPELGDSYNVLDPVYQTKKLIEGKQAAIRIADFFKKYVPGFENSCIGKFASMLGVRESRQIYTKYFMNVDDVFSYRKFDDSIAMSDYEIDVHGVNSTVKELEGKKYNKALPENEWYFTIPYSSLVVKDFDNLSVAGRCAGFDFYVQSSARVQHTCRYMGEAVGIGSAVAVKNNLSVQDVDGKQVRKIMQNKGADLY